ncbi:T-cell surface antigen CD2-like isoform X1 [Acipenser ruthenus]|uniref:T-cell surface antigen CD2-like isoform X1 n=1 Tax=Acipenser ruthenus TaxID=7906 RepID=UPI00145B587A|nr:T-cell surface antigen CD2-like isoform X1 [Acipenser ruthenus]
MVTMNTCKNILHLLLKLFFLLPSFAGIVSEQEVVCGVQGQSVVLAMESKNLTNFFDIVWKAGDDRIARLNNAIPSYYGDHHGKVEIFVNGTIRLNRAEQDDSGNYTVEVFDSNGKSIVRRSIQVYIQGVTCGFLGIFLVAHAVLQAAVAFLLILFIIRQASLQRNQGPVLKWRQVFFVDKTYEID